MTPLNDGIVRGANDGGPAFPVDALAHAQGFSGMTLRDYFAAKALDGLIASSEGQPCETTTPEGIERERREYAAELATASYRYADAMLAARGGAS